ncbi:GDP-L-fucose synthase [Chryseobacterium arthrosphaerae]|uniref:GDP-L-fucose synthase family protein n=1 Tax=Chryseobacterium arthrosphaerae TaxID=651561 RepID=UPI000F5092FD|nr:GDP-L-fucose synthase [Chryseobacterium arthrosphaerae]AYZ14727.1 GDP-L-fucose synthase [Chryseobacterium arthrosphaerae]QUY55582.1 GDP-L-fucose synthase [Chryseobacterium arthrosphaerae]
MNPNSKIYIAGHRGMVGSAIVRNLTSNGFNNIVTKTSDELDLTDQKNVQSFFETEKPEYVFLAAAKVGGIYANNTYRADFLYQNLMIETNVIHQSYLHGVKKLLFLGSSCIYPKLAPQPLKEEYLLSGFLEQTNEPYAIAKIAGIKMCDAYRSQYDCNFISAMPTNLYGPNDNYDLNNSHVLPAMLRKFFEAKQNNVKEVVLWGDGSPFREFLHVDDLAKACVFLMNNYNESGHINIGSSREISISELAMQIKDITQYEGNIVWDTEKPNGTPRKLMDSSKINSMGWSPDISLEDGIKQVYQEKFLNK